MENIEQEKAPERKTIATATIELEEPGTVYFTSFRGIRLRMELGKYHLGAAEAGRLVLKIIDGSAVDSLHLANLRPVQLKPGEEK